MLRCCLILCSLEACELRFPVHLILLMSKEAPVACGVVPCNHLFKALRI